MIKTKSTSNIKPNKMNALIFGESGVGKTTLASTLSGKTIIISMESGLLSLKSFDIDYVEINDLSELRDILSQLSGSDYDNIFIDSLSEIGQLFFSSAKKKYPEDRQTMKLYGHLLETMTSFIKYCRDINKNIFFTALQKTTQDESGKMFRVPDLQGSIAVKCPAFFDFVFNYQIVDFDEKQVRCLITDKQSGTIAKDRSGMLEQYEQPDLSIIIKKIFNE